MLVRPPSAGPPTTPLPPFGESAKSLVCIDGGNWHPLAFEIIWGFTERILTSSPYLPTPFPAPNG